MTTNDDTQEEFDSTVVFYSVVLLYIWDHLDTFGPEVSDEEIAIVAVDRAICLVDSVDISEWDIEALHVRIASEVERLREARRLSAELDEKNNGPPSHLLGSPYVDLL